MQVSTTATCAAYRKQCVMRDPPPSANPSESAEHSSALRFGPFQLISSRRLLLESGKPVKLGSRAFEILHLLVSKAGQIVTREELIARVWPTTVVEEVNLRVHVAALRRALSDGQHDNRYIVNTTGRGYSFVATVTNQADYAVPLSAPSSATAKHNLPSTLTQIVGRASEIKTLVSLAHSQRLLTLAGPAGVGKSTLALAVARQLLTHFRQGAHFIDLGALASAGLVPSAFATAMGFTVSLGNPLSDLVDYLYDKSLLLVLDNCEHHVAAVAATTETVLRQCSGIHVLATSREALNAEGEWIYQVLPLSLPAGDDSELSAEIAHQYAAVELFVERAVISDHCFMLTDLNAPVVAHICRSLDGLPLAIELAAARVNLHGIQELSVRLDDQVSRFARGRRTAASRHQTLRASLDWSYEVLTEHERIALRRLSVFHGAFTMESAIGLLAQHGLGAQEASFAVVGLADKSLITTDVSANAVRHRLLTTTRSYAFERLSAAQEVRTTIRTHAEQTLKLMRQAELVWETMTRSEWIEKYGYAIDDVRAALDWAFSSDGDASLGTALTAVSVPFGFQLALIEEFSARAQYALDWVTARGTGSREVELRLRGALSVLRQNTRRPRQLDEALDSQLAERLRTPKQHITPLLQKTIYQIEIADYSGALSTSEKMGMVARKTADPLAVLMADRVAAQAQHFCGNHATARVYAERVLDHPAKGIPLAYISVQVDRRVSMRIVLARITWLEGHAEQSLALVNETLELAASDSPFALCQALALAACPIALWCGNYAEAQKHVTLLMQESDRYRLDFWRSYGEWFQKAVSSDGCATVCTESETRGRESEVCKTASGLLFDTMLTINPSLVITEPAVLECTKPSGWSCSETLRVQGQLMLEGTSSEGASRAEIVFLRAIEVAEQQNALAWNLRASLCLGRLWSRQNRKMDAFTLLNGVLGRFSEGFETRDLREAVALRDRIA
jgi:predicted ATPase/DNA-binding winged helix-turn-helix (wHTH) protein